MRTHQHKAQLSIPDMEEWGADLQKPPLFAPGIQFILGNKGEGGKVQGERPLTPALVCARVMVQSKINMFWYVW